MANFASGHYKFTVTSSLGPAPAGPDSEPKLELETLNLKIETVTLLTGSLRGAPSGRRRAGSAAGTFKGIRRTPAGYMWRKGTATKPHCGPGVGSPLFRPLADCRVRPRVHVNHHDL